MEDECMICYSPMSNDVKIIFENCKHFFCRDCLKDFLKDIFRVCPIDEIPPDSLKVFNGTTEISIKIDFIDLFQYINDINFNQYDPPIYFQKQCTLLKDFQSLNLKQTEPEFKEIIERIIVYFQRVPDYMDAFCMDDFTYLGIVEVLMGMPTTYRFLIKELEKNILNIFFLSRRECSFFCIISNSFRDYKENIISRAQLIGCLDHIFDKLDKFYEQYIYSLHLTEWLKEKFSVYLVNFTSYPLEKFLLRSPKTKNSRIDFTASNNPRGNPRLIARMNQIEEVIADGIDENVDRFVYNEEITYLTDELENIKEAIENTLRKYRSIEDFPSQRKLISYQFYTLNLNAIRGGMNYEDVFWDYDVYSAARSIRNFVRNCKKNIKRTDEWSEIVARMEEVLSVLESLHEIRAMVNGNEKVKKIEKIGDIMYSKLRRLY